MSLLLLLFVPIIIGLGGFLIFRKRISWQELLVLEIVVIVLLSMTFYITASNNTRDVEIWSGRVVDKIEETTSCCHSYQCNPHSCMCDEDGCSTCYDICHIHSYDIEWNAVSSNGENVFHDGCNPPGTEPPERWREITIGDPTAVEHSYVNYIKGNPDTILRRSGVQQSFTTPPYPGVYDWYRAVRFIPVGVNDTKFTHWDNLLDELNADLGSKKQVNVIIVVVNESNPQWTESLREKWIGGKKNDFIVIIGAPEYPKIQWVSVMSWSGDSSSENAKISVRNRILDLDQEFDGEKIISIIREEVGSKFVRKEMKDFKYLKASVEPSSGTKIIIFILGIILSLVLTYWFWKEDLFETYD